MASSRLAGRRWRARPLRAELSRHVTVCSSASGHATTLLAVQRGPRRVTVLTVVTLAGFVGGAGLASCGGDADSISSETVTETTQTETSHDDRDRPSPDGHRDGRPDRGRRRRPCGRNRSRDREERRANRARGRIGCCGRDPSPRIRPDACRWPPVARHASRFAPRSPGASRSSSRSAASRSRELTVEP